MKNLLIIISLFGMTLAGGPLLAQTAGGEPEAAVTEQAADASEQIDTDEVKQKVNEVIDAIANRVKQEVDAEIHVEIDDVSAEDLEELDKLKSAIETGDWSGHSGIDAGEVAVAVTAIIFSLGLPIIILLVVLFYANRKRKQKMELINQFINADQPVPDQLINEFNTGSGDPLRSGLQLVGVGLGIALFFLVLGEPEPAGIGLIPFGLGAARLIYWKVNKDKAEQ